VFLDLLSNGMPVSAPSITEIGYGQYKFSYDAVASGEVSGQIDCGVTLTNPSDRFIDVEMVLDSSKIVQALPSAPPAGSGGLPTVNGSNQVLALDGSGNSLATAANLATANTNISAIESQTGKIGTNAGDSPNQQSAQTTIATNLNATVSSRQASGSAVTLPSPAPSGYGSSGAGSGTGPNAINQNTGGTDNLRYVDSSGSGIEGANILIYLASDWPGNPGNVQANATTGADGRWLAPAFVVSGTYVAVFVKVGADGPDVSSPFTV
jgi:hypothetical protein